MRQASWEEMWRAGDVPPPPEPRHARPWANFSWEEPVTLAIVMIGFLTVVESINGADWVNEMPSLYPMAFLGLLTGFLLARTRLHEALAHLVALAIGAVGIFLSGTSSLTGTLPDKFNELTERTKLWGEALTGGGISNDNLPFVLLVVALTYLMAYLAAWSIFRWYNAWIALIPAGLALLTNISYLPGQRSLPLLIYLFSAILLIARLNVLRRQRSWRDDRTAYPEMMSLHVLNVTVWIGLLLLAFAWFLPVGSGSGALFTLWQKITAPVVDPLSDLGRVFAAIDSKRGGTVHRFGSTLPLQGEISLGGGEVMKVTASEPGYLRAQAYDFYTAQGWKVGTTSQITTSAWPALKALQGPEDARRQLRRPIALQVTTSKKTNVIVTAGQPLSINVDTRVVFGPDASDVSSIRPNGTLNKDAQYRVDSTVSNASVGRLSQAGSVYPAWMTSYLQLPSNLPQSITRKAQEVTIGAQSAYDKANLIEQYLRTFAIDTKIDPAPAKKDSVEYFLFTARRGYFDYHASAMVVMLRSIGVPARLAVGYVIRPQDRMPDTSTYVVAEANAFAWPEVYFPGLGWVEFNPTPSEPRINRIGSDDLGFTGLNDDEELEEDDLGTAPTEPIEPAEGPLNELQLDEDSNFVSRAILSILLLVVGLTAVGGTVFRYTWQRGLGGLDYPVQVWEKTMRLAKWARIRALPQETPRELVVRLRRELPEVEDLGYLGDTFVRAQYGHKDLAPAEKERLEAVWKRARNNLIARILRWK